jgi:hypothetical protein
MRPHGLVISGSGRPFEIHAPKWDREKYELVFARMASDANFTGDFEVTFRVAFDGVDEVLRGHDPVVVLKVMAREVEEVISLSETMSKAIGLI